MPSQKRKGEANTTKRQQGKGGTNTIRTPAGGPTQTGRHARSTHVQKRETNTNGAPTNEKARHRDARPTLQTHDSERHCDNDRTQGANTIDTTHAYSTALTATDTPHTTHNKRRARRSGRPTEARTGQTHGGTAARAELSSHARGCRQPSHLKGRMVTERPPARIQAGVGRFRTRRN